MMAILGFIVFGLVVGVIAKLIMPGRDPGGMFMTAVIGMIGAVVGGLIGRYLLGRSDDYAAGWIMSIIGTLILLFLYRKFSSNKTP